MVSESSKDSTTTCSETGSSKDSSTGSWMTGSAGSCSVASAGKASCSGVGKGASSTEGKGSEIVVSSTARSETTFSSSFAGCSGSDWAGIRGDPGSVVTEYEGVQGDLGRSSTSTSVSTTRALVSALHGLSQQRKQRRRITLPGK